ncbi:hypothetical protein N7519_009313 [Penicillium mononematosum]|uniref:uncharacterized protein n=1 Tax=Penicillium mononematosum TaxID=268346 RepID=UPI002547235E|nr:uncharacterized protein N7519_009313 [Penicillium mononematosum]KAJ6178852.1 hypothetical protein N7519_009313 [Penicillium mononematosum]
MESNNPIYQWLSTVEDQGQTENQEQVKDTALATGIPRIHIPLETSDDLRANGHSASRKRDSRHLKETKASSTHETIPGSEGHKRSRNCYELRPRYKTREDRYEYKGPSSAVETQSQSRKGRAKKPRGRRHTMNDDFRAINVTGNRLTLRSNTNLGIFNKGRSSSVANQHGNTPAGLAKPASVTRSQKYVAESDLAFSEMNFLSRRSNLSPYPMSTARETLDGQHEREYHPQEVQFDDPAHDSKLGTSHSDNKLVDVKRKLDASVMPLFAFEEAPVSEMYPVSGHSRSASPMPHNKRRKISKQSSSIPYTWTETEVDDTEQSDALEQHLLNLLHVGVYPQGLCSETKNTVLTGRYWSLAELWELLEERKTSWSSEAGRQNRTSPEANTAQLAAVKASPQEVPKVTAADDLDVHNAGSVQNETSKQSADSDIACEMGCSVNSPPKQPSVLEQQQDGPHEASDKPGCLSLQASRALNSPDRFIDTLNEDHGEPSHQESAEDAVLFPALPDVEQPHMSDIEFYELGRVDDDDVFYRTLDAAYCAIVRPEVVAEVASDLQQLLESPELNGNDLPNTPEPTSIREPDIPTGQVEGAEPEHLVTASQDIIQDGYDGRPSEPSCKQKLSTSHSNDPCVDQNNDLPWMATGYGQTQPRASTGIDAGHAKPPGLSGFWRQNRLY